MCPCQMCHTPTLQTNSALLISMSAAVNTLTGVLFCTIVVDYSNWVENRHDMKLLFLTLMLNTAPTKLPILLCSFVHLC